MSGSLFAEYPPVPAEARDDACCASWELFEREHHPVDRSCRVVHRLAHSTTPFSPAKVADLTGSTLYGARLVVADACQRRWVYRLSATGEPELYAGMLAAAKRSGAS
jgi:hypothetical protein